MATENKTTLLIMAAGMGSRFGGLKQIEPLGPSGEVILDYSIYDAVEAGFSKAVFVITKKIEKDFREVIGKRVEKKIDVSYAFQSLDDIPKEFEVPEGRVKPWGTGQAVLCAIKEVTTPFCVINADDYYGKSSFKIMNNHLVSSDEMCMIGFKLGNTLTDNGTVARGICQMEDGYLKSIVENTSIDKNSGIPLDTLVSMNMWGFMPDIFEKLEKGFTEFLKTNNNPLKGEYFIPLLIDDLINNKGEKVKVLPANDKWYGVTYKEDKESVMEAFKKFTEDGLYNGI